MEHVRWTVNEFLFHEFGFDVAHDSAEVAPNWPFTLALLGENDSGAIFRFEQGGESYFAVAGKRLSYLPTAGMGLAEIRLQRLGESWLLEHDPVDLDTEFLGDDSVPGARVRFDAIEALAHSALRDSCNGREPRKGQSQREGSSPTQLAVNRGLYFRRTGSYVALVEDKGSGTVHLVGTDLAPRCVGFPEASADRRLALALGELLAEGQIG